MTHVRIHLVGTARLEVDGAEVALPPGRPTELLAWLAVHPGTHPRSSVASTLWPDVSDSTSRASLRTALWALRKQLEPVGAEVLVHDRHAVGLDRDHVSVDLDGAAAPTAPERALAIPVDGILEGIQTEWADDARAEHRRTVSRALSALDRSAEEAGDVETCLAVARRLAEIEPFSEEHHRLLLRRLRAAGDHAAAVGEHESFRRRLWDELGVRPSPATRELVGRLTAPAPEPGTDRPALPARLAHGGADVFVGRDAELDRLLDAWRSARESSGPAVVLLSGESGIGKTSLAARFAAEISDQAVVLFGGASEDALLPGEPFLEAIDEHRTFDAAQLVDLVRQRIEAHAAAHPVLLVLDDFHWADHVSFALLRRLSRSQAAGHLAVLALTRSDPTSHAKFAPLVEDLAGRGRLTRIELGSLSLPATEALLATLDPAGDLAQRAARVHAETGGNPLFVHELGRHLVHAGDTLPGSPVPQTVRDLVVGRLQRLSPVGAGTMAAAAVLGHQVRLDVLRHLVAPEFDPLDGLEDAMRFSLVHELSAGLHTFRHSLVREAIYEHLSKSRRAELHRRAADAIRAVQGDEDGPHLCAIAEHRCAAVPSDSMTAAVADARRAAAWAVEHDAYERAVVVLTKALQVADESMHQELTVTRAVAYQRLTHAFIDPVPAGAPDRRR